MPATHDADPAGADIRLLVVEDDPIARFTLSEGLRCWGYEVEEAESGDAALDALSEDPNFDLVVSDIQMPGEVDGAALAIRLRSERPDLPVLLTSGRTPPSSVATFPFLAKPFSTEEAVIAINRVLRSAAGACGYRPDEHERSERAPLG